MKNRFLFFGIVVMIFSTIGVGNAYSQIINGAYQRSDTYQKKPMPLPAIREADVFWSKMVWRIIDLREKINQPMYYPTVPTESMSSLAALLMKGVETSQITAYDARNDDDFKTPLTVAEVKEFLGAATQTVETRNFDTGEMELRTVEGQVRLEDIKQFMIKEEWYFDKQNSRLQVRVVGICPIREYFRDDDMTGQVQRQKVFWIYYPEARDLLATTEVLNPYNNSHRMSYDDLFIKRYFNSYIVQESNIYNNRLISQYLTGKNAMLESKLIEENIFNFEQDLWEY